jgi:hypothetical protein
LQPTRHSGLDPGIPDIPPAPCKRRFFCLWGDRLILGKSFLSLRNELITNTMNILITLLFGAIGGWRLVKKLLK